MSFIPYPKQTVLWLLSGVPLDPSYENTVNFLTKAEQEQAFMAFPIKRSYSAQSYQRAGLGVIRIAELADNIYRYNYLMFKNNEDSSISPQFGDKWFYGFIEDVVYINDHACEVHYSIDVMQTYMFDYALGMCYVEREHSETDAFGQHVTPEPIPAPDVLVQATTDLTTNLYSNTHSWWIVFYYVANENVIATAAQSSVSPYPLFAGEPTARTATDGDRAFMFDGTMAGLTWTYLTADLTSPEARQVAVSNMSKMVAKLVDISATIVNIELVPTVVAGQTIVTEGLDFTDTQGSAYTPKNKKLYTYPYRYIMVGNNQGDTAKYKWEDFERAGWTNRSPMEAAFEIAKARLPHYTQLLRPVPADYKKPSIENSITAQNTNQVAWSEDSFSKWWAVNSDSFIGSCAMQVLNTTIAAIGIAMGATSASAVNTGTGRQYMQGNNSQPFSPSAMNLVGSAVGDIVQDTATIATQKNQPDRLVGGLSQSAILNSIGQYGFTIYDMGLRARDAKIIDDFFSKYGYAVKRVKLPNIEASVANLRPHWNYIKTKGCTLSSEYLPTSASRIIEQVYDKGITFWKQFSEVGNYSLDNSPT